MKKTIILICFIILSQISHAQEKKYLYSGGMLLLQPGYAMTSNPSQNINSLGFGIGGILRFYLKKHLTLGIIGGSQKTGYQSSRIYLYKKQI
jgi:TM2 domain-containing membrane protein YozV